MKKVKQLKRFFHLFLTAVKGSWEQLWKSFVLLVVITLVLATVFYIYESRVNPDYQSWLQSVTWSFFYYIGDPGGFGGSGPLTFVGKNIAIILSVVNILIFAIPAGIIASGFTSALEADTKAKKMADDCASIEKAFKPAQCRHTMIRTVPTYKSIVTLQVQTGLTADNIIEAVDHLKTAGLRLRNLADSYALDDNAPDRLVTEYFPVTPGKDYGCMVNRGSNVTIVCPSSYKYDEIGDSHFGYMLAVFGGFNFISREFDLDNSASYYLLPQGVTYDGREWHDPAGRLTPTFHHFFDDLMKLAEGDSKWVIFLLQFSSHLNTHLGFVTNSKINDTIGSSVHDIKEFNTAYEEIARMLANHDYTINAGERETDRASSLSADLNTVFRPIGSRNITNAITGATGCNAFTIRMASSLMARDRRDVSIALRMADILRRDLIGEDSYQTDHMKEWKQQGIAY